MHLTCKTNTYTLKTVRMMTAIILVTILYNILTLDMVILQLCLPSKQPNVH